MAAWEADWQLRIGNVDAAARWADRSGLSPADSPTLLREAEYLHLRPGALGAAPAGRGADAAGAPGELCPEQRPRAEPYHGAHLQAAALQALGQREQAMARLEEAVRLAAPGGYRRAFLDEGPAVAALLPGVRHAAPEFVEGLLGGMPPPTALCQEARGAVPADNPSSSP